MQRFVFLAVRFTVPVALAGSIAIFAPRSFAHTRASAVTWSKDVAGILERRCVTCHAPASGIQPDLSTYEAARASARAVRDAILEGRMPPWPAARGIGDFRNDRSLSLVELELLTAWANGDAPLGSPDPVAAVKHESRPEPSVTLRVPAGHPRRASIERLQVDATYPSLRWLTGWTFEPGNPAIVQRAMVSIVGGEPIGSWVPGEEMIRYPPGVAQRLPPGAALRVEVYYRKSTETTTPEGALSLFLGSRPQFALRHRTLGCEPNSLGDDTEILAVTPLASEADALIEVFAVRPDQSITPLVAVPHFSPGDPLTYRLRNAVRLPRRSTVHVRSSAPGCRADLDFIVRRPIRADQ
jgi:hypothetical protein